VFGRSRDEGLRLTMPRLGFFADRGNRGTAKMTVGDHSANPKTVLRCLCTGVALLVIATFPSQAKAEETFEGPSFRRGMWHFVRTLDLVVHRKNKQRLLAREMTRCVDPTQSMKATFSSPSVGSCVSSKPERSDNKYTFANRCDHM